MNNKGKRLQVGEVVEYEELKDSIRVVLNFDPTLDPAIKRQCEEKPQAINLVAFPQRPTNVLIVP